MSEITKYLNRPKSWAYLLEKTGRAKSSLSRDLQASSVIKTELNLYSKKGWFTNLGDKWTSNDVVTHCVIIFNAWLNLPMTRDDKSPDNVRRLANHMERAASQLQTFADELHRRANALELGDYGETTEVAE